jgi:hypothetical protein
MTRAAISPETRVRISPSVYARAFGDEIVLLDFGRGEYFGLDEVGAEIWRRIESGDAVSQIADRIVERYEVRREDALHDIVELVATMNERALVSIA